MGVGKWIKNNSLLGKVANEVGDIFSGDSGGNTGPGNYEQTLAEMAKKLFEQGDPTRARFFGQFEDLLSGNFNPQESPMFAPSFALGKQGIEDQYGIAKENILSGLPRGGGMSTALGELELGRAEQESSLPALLSQKIIDDMMTKAYGASFGGAMTAPISGIGTAAGIESNRSLVNAQLQQQQEQMLWSALGGILGMGAMAL